MPIITPSSYRPPLGFANGHVQTLLRNLWGTSARPPYRREELDLADGDYVGLDWLCHEPDGVDRLAILTHGLEGSSRSPHVLSLAAVMHRSGWDVLAWNFRGCGGTSHRLARLYHSGASEDLAAVVSQALARHPARQVALAGFSIGGNITLKYLGEMGTAVDPRIRGGLAFSVPVDLAASVRHMAQPANAIYMKYFLDRMRARYRSRRESLPVKVSERELSRMRTFMDFDDPITAPLHGFSSAEDYYARAACLPWLGKIAIPTLLVNARNDPFLPASCFPERCAHANPSFFLETPASGGHCAFLTAPWEVRGWTEQRALAFLDGDGRNEDSAWAACPAAARADIEPAA
jgi:hypothetical protein